MKKPKPTITPILFQPMT